MSASNNNPVREDNVTRILAKVVVTGGDPVDANDLARKSYVDGVAGIDTQWGHLHGTLSDQTDLNGELGNKEDTANKSVDADLGGGSPSDTLFPTQQAVKTYVDNHASGGLPPITPDASAAGHADNGGIITNIVIGDFNDRILIVGATVLGAEEADILDVMLNDINMVQVSRRKNPDTGNTELLYMMTNPPIGTFGLAIDLAGPHGIDWAYASYYNVAPFPYPITKNVIRGTAIDTLQDQIDITQDNSFIVAFGWYAGAGNLAAGTDTVKRDGGGLAFGFFDTNQGITIPSSGHPDININLPDTNNASLLAMTIAPIGSVGNGAGIVYDMGYPSESAPALLTNVPLDGSTITVFDNPIDVPRQLSMNTSDNSDITVTGTDIRDNPITETGHGNSLRAFKTVTSVVVPNNADQTLTLGFTEFYGLPIATINPYSRLSKNAFNGLLFGVNDIGGIVYDALEVSKNLLQIEGASGNDNFVFYLKTHDLLPF